MTRFTQFSFFFFIVYYDYIKAFNILKLCTEHIHEADFSILQRRVHASAIHTHRLDNKIG